MRHGWLVWFWLGVFTPLQLDASCITEPTHTTQPSNLAGSQKTSTIRKSASLGGQQTLDCTLKYPRNEPVPYIIQWKKDGLTQPIFIKYDGYPAQIPPQRYRNRIKLSGEVSLLVSNVQADDEGWYECNIIFIDGAEETTVNGSWIYLTVHSRPYITSSSKSLLQHRRGETVTMFCEGKGSPTPSLTWFKEGRPLRDTFRQIVDGTRVTIKNLQRADGGIYMCTFVNSVGEISQLIKLVVEGGPLIMVSPHNMTAVEGQGITIRCDALAYPNNITYHWFKDGNDVKTLAGYQVHRIQILDDGSLRISSVVKEDMAWYMCRPSNGFGEDEASAFLNVTYLPKVLPMPSTLMWANGFNEKIDCKVDANPPVTKTIWTKDSHKLVNSNRIKILKNGTLLVSNVTTNDQGSYGCTPVSLRGRGDSSAHVQVIVKDPPSFKLRPNHVYLRSVSESVFIPCVAVGEPEPIVMWKRVGTSIDEGRVSIIGGNLTINDLSKEDHGKYECIASNSVATIIAMTELRIMDTTPHAPNNLTVVPSLFSAKVSWEPAYDGGSPQKYVLWFRELESKDRNWETIGIPQGSTTFTLYALMADTMYEFMVLARNSLGDSMFSDHVQAKTLGYHDDFVTALPTDSSGSTYIPVIIEPRGPRPGIPRNVTAKLVDDGILVSWLPPLSTEVPIFYYTIDYRSDGLWTRYEGEVMVSMGRSLVLEGMKTGTTFELRVISNGVLAFSKSSNIVTIATPESLALPDALIGGIIGGLLFLLVAILLAVIAVIHSRRKEQKNKTENRYNDVNYSKPEESENRHQTPPKWDRWQQPRGGDAMRLNDDHQGVYILPRSTDRDYSYNARPSILRDSRLYDRNHPIYDPAAGYRVTPDEEPNLVADLSLSPLSGNYRRSPRDQPDHPVPRSPRNISDSRWPPASPMATGMYPSDYHPSTPSGGNYPEMNMTPSRYNRWSEPHDEDPRRRNSNLSPVNLGYDGPYSDHSDDDDDGDENGFLPKYQNVPSSRPAFPRHSSMKPAHQTYLTDSEAVPPPYGIDDISSVLPSPHENRSLSHYPSSSSQPSYLPSQINRPTDFLHEPQHEQARPYDPSTHELPRHEPSTHELSRHEPPTHELPRPYDRQPRGSDRDYLPNIPEDSLDSTVIPDPRATWSPPKPGGDENNSSTGSSGGRPIGYTRDQLQGVVDRVRQGPRARADETLDEGGFLDASGLPQQSPYDDRVFRFPEPNKPHGLDNRGAPYYTSDVAPFKPPRANIPDRRPSSRSRDEMGPDTVSHSSGIGSRNTSNSNSSFPNRLGKNSMSYSSLLTPQEQDLSQDSSPFLDGSSYNRRDTSGDENYEFDSIGAMESDILDALRNYSRVSDSGGRDAYGSLYPKSRKPSRYSDSEDRFNKLREEFKRYQQQQAEVSGDVPGPMYPMDSEML